MNKNQQALVHLGLIQGIGPVTLQKILTGLQAEQLYTLYERSVPDLMYTFGLTLHQATLLFEGMRSTKELEAELLLAQKNRIEIITLVDQAYPALLKQIHYSPTCLYVQGSLPIHDKNLAIVGSRKAHAYAQNVIEYLVPDIVARGWAIISGGALGADTMAHRATLKAGGKTVAVLGSGLLQLYPKSNMRMFDEIIAQGGALVSPFPLLIEPLKGNFPARNRIISGMSQGCLVVQAAQKSGAAITASFALEQGREVFAVPGSIFDELSGGCHRLLQQGAKLVGSARDILIEFGEDFQQEVSEIQQTIVEAQPLTFEDSLLLVCKKPQPIDVLVEQTGKSLDDIQAILFDLQLSGKIGQDFAGYWQST